MQSAWAPFGSSVTPISDQLVGLLPSFNFEAPAAFHFAYDSASCEWKSIEMGLDVHAVRVTGPLQ